MDTYCLLSILPCLSHILPYSSFLIISCLPLSTRINTMSLLYFNLLSSYILKKLIKITKTSYFLFFISDLFYSELYFNLKQNYIYLCNYFYSSGTIYTNS